MEKCLHFNSYKDALIGVNIAPSESQLNNHHFTFTKLIIQEIQSICRY